jgi:hypothetical protein
MFLETVDPRATFRPQLCFLAVVYVIALAANADACLFGPNECQCTEVKPEGTKCIRVHSVSGKNILCQKDTCTERHRYAKS